MPKAKRKAKLASARVETVRDRIVKVERMPARSLRSHPENWRTHDGDQRAVMRGLLTEIGFVGAVLAYVAREGDEYVEQGKVKVGDVVLIDGHLRTEEVPQEFEVSVMITDLTEREAKKVLATFDPVGALAGQNDEHLIRLLEDIETESAAVMEMISDLVSVDDAGASGDDETPPEKWQILIECEGEDQQRELLDELMSRGVQCRSLIA